MCVRVGFNSGIKCVKNQRIVIAVSDNKGDNPAVIQIQNGTEINLVYGCSFIPLKLSHICQPLLIGHSGMELAVQPVLRDVLGIGGLPGTAVVLVLNSRLDIQTAADAKYSLFINIQLVIVGQIILDPAVALIRAFSMDLLHKFRNLLIFLFSGALSAADPAVVCCSGYAEHTTR